MLMIIDCGTTNLRVALVDERGAVLATAKRPGGVRHTAIDGHNGQLKLLLREAMEEALDSAEMTWSDVSGCYAYGMITSNMGLLELPHLAAPISAEDLRLGMRSALFEDVAPIPIAFIPGVRNFAGAVNADNFSDMDMMRGEEVESIGLWSLLQPKGESLFILPGSHNKFVHTDADGRILGCTTSISGELLDALTHHTILADAVGRAFADAETYDADIAIQGARECTRSGLGRAAFAGRILSQLGNLPQEKLRSYLLGAVLAQDVLALRAYLPDPAGTALYIAGKQPLQQAFADIMASAGLSNATLVSQKITERMGYTGVLNIIQKAAPQKP